MSDKRKMNHSYKFPLINFFLMFILGSRVFCEFQRNPNTSELAYVGFAILATIALGVHAKMLWNIHQLRKKD